jgi:hypothetical protein
MYVLLHINAYCFYDARRLPPFYAEDEGRASTAALSILKLLSQEDVLC